MVVDKNGIEEDPQSYQKIIVFLLFLAGLLNSQQYLFFMGLTSLSHGITLMFYFLLFLMFIIMILNSLHNKMFPLLRYKYSLLLMIGVGIKFFILFVQFPTSFFPGGENFTYLLIIGTNFIIILIVPYYIKNVYYLKAAIWALGIGVSFSALIPFIFFSDMVGQRAVENFSGSFWNYSLISFISVGWLLVSLSSTVSNKLKKNILIAIFIMLIIGSLAGLSRSILISLFCSIIIYLIVTNQLLKNLRFIVSLCFAVILLFYFFQEPINNYMERLDGGINIEEESRSLIWKDYIENIPDYVMFGAIDGDYRQYSSIKISPHSAILNWLTQFGILSLVGFIILIFGMLKITSELRRNYSQYFAAGLYAWIVSYLSVALINETGFDELTIYCSFSIILVIGSLLDKGKLNRV